MTAQALLSSCGDPVKFARSLAWRLRFWLLGLPAGVGLATARGILRLWIGFPPGRAGVCSAGNGPAMRSPILGVCAGDNPQRLRDLVSASTRLTHIDERAEQGALAVALCCHYAATRPADRIVAGEVFELLRRDISNALLRGAFEAAERALSRGMTAGELACEMGLEKGVTGYIVHTVPIAIFCWLRHPTDFRAAVEEVVLLGGDADTTGAITGALAGATVGAKGIPPEWLDGLWEWPRTIRWIRRLAGRHAEQQGDAVAAPVRLFWPGILSRNILFLVIVLLHGMRRLLPPY
jgi:ADP-ribosylglycohydrolase